MRSILLALAAITVAASAAAQTTPATGNPVDVRTPASIMAQAKTLLPEARKSPEGIASVTLEKYPGHFTMLAVRVKDGGAEVHANVSDFLIVEEGDATEITGGTVVNPKEISPGETRGLKVEGGTPHQLHKGDIMHIMPGVPHQALVPAGKTFIYYVIKVSKTP